MFHHYRMTRNKFSEQVHTGYHCKQLEAPTYLTGQIWRQIVQPIKIVAELFLQQSQETFGNQDNIPAEHNPQYKSFQGTAFTYVTVQGV